jgi:glucan phosphoethanolaminetransferase (alkaline phosphatase superfamily)
MAELSNMKDTWNVLAVKPKYHTYVVVIGESARRDAMGAFGGHWDNTPFASSVKGTCLPIMSRPAARRRNRSA